MLVIIIYCHSLPLVLDRMRNIRISNCAQGKVGASLMDGRIKLCQISISDWLRIKTKRQRIERKDAVAIIGSDVYQSNIVNHDSKNCKCDKYKDCYAGGCLLWMRRGSVMFVIGMIR